MLGAVVSRRIGKHAAFYVEPIWVNNTNPLPKQLVDHNDTFMIGLGTRIRVRPTVYVVMEASPRVAGYEPGITHGGFAIEKHAGGHQFQLNFSDSFATTMGHIDEAANRETGTWDSTSPGSSSKSFCNFAARATTQPTAGPWC